MPACSELGLHLFGSSGEGRTFFDCCCDASSMHPYPEAWSPWSEFPEPRNPPLRYEIVCTTTKPKAHPYQTIGPTPLSNLRPGGLEFDTTRYCIYCNNASTCTGMAV